MAVHLINQSSRLPTAAHLVVDGDTVIATNHEAAMGAIQAFAHRSVAIALVKGTSTQPEAMSTTKSLKIISEADWVGYTTGDETVVSWG